MINPSSRCLPNRDRIAIEFATAILSSNQTILPDNRDKLAVVAYQYADAIITQSQKPTGDK